MTKQEMRDILNFAPRPVAEIFPEGHSALHGKKWVQNRLVDPRLKNCDCGCEGDWTNHSMRLGEQGIYGAR